MKWNAMGVLVVSSVIVPGVAWASAPQDRGSVQIDIAPSQQVLTVRPYHKELPWLFDIGVRGPAGVLSADLGLAGHLVQRPIFGLWSDVRFGPRVGVRDGMMPGLGLRASLLPGWRKGFFRLYVGPELDMAFMSGFDAEYRVTPVVSLRVGAALGPVDVWLSGAAGYSFGGYDAGSIRYDGSLVLTYRFLKHGPRQ